MTRQGGFVAVLSLAVWLAAMAAGANAQQADQPMGGHMMTRWAAEVSAENALPEYPRPQMTRERWLNLNGQWDYAITSRGAMTMERADGQILVPFCIQSALSGVRRNVLVDQALWYHRTFTVPDDWKGQRVLLHFGAVDWQATVFVNGYRLGEHRGGYTPFSFDVTDYLKPEGSQELVVKVWDPTNDGTQPRGKQVKEPQGIWYTAVTGIWQTVWLEPAPSVFITELRATPDIDSGSLRLTVKTNKPTPGYGVEAQARDGAQMVGRAHGEVGESLTIPVPNAKLWSPDSPHLYDLRVMLRYQGRVADEVGSYFGMRKIALGKDAQGHLRFELNNKPLFHLGPLDQGWWPDGLYTAPTDAALLYDIEITKRLGFNMARKHVKVEPARWYYHCDKQGLLVWQDMPSAYLGGRGPNSLFVAPEADKDADRDQVSAAQFETELREMMDALHHFPSIVVWVPFNEGWGQYETERVAGWVKQYDPTRLVNATSGWTDRGAGDMYDTHMYPGPGMEDPGPGRATVLGEFGGLGWPVEGHLWWNKRNWGYRTYQDRESLNASYMEVVGNVRGLIGRGLTAAVYTQTTDVEGEVNGLMTYDRAVIKFDEAALVKLHDRLYAPAPKARVILPTAESAPQQWRYADQEPASRWTAPVFNDSGWKQGAGPFQAGNDALFPTGTKWTAGGLWMRRTFDLDAVPKQLYLEVLHNVSAGAVYLNGTKIVDLAEHSATRRHYGHLDITPHARLLRPGRNVLALQGTPAENGGALDAGLYAIE